MLQQNTAVIILIGSNGLKYLVNIQTTRLILIPITLEVTESLINGSCREIEELGIKTDGKWPTEDTKDILDIFMHSHLIF